MRVQSARMAVGEPFILRDEKAVWRRRFLTVKKNRPTGRFYEVGLRLIGYAIERRWRLITDGESNLLGYFGVIGRTGGERSRK